MTASLTTQLTLSMAIAFAASPARAGGSIRCDAGLVSAGDTAVDLLAKCGPPALREERVVEQSVASELDGVVHLRRSARTVERWTYDFGPGRFIEIVTIDGGAVRHVETGGYGYAAEEAGSDTAAAPPRCEPGISPGDTTLDVLARCGEPTWRDRRDEQRTVLAVASSEGGRVERRLTVAVETWIYDLGPDRLLVIAALEDGKVVWVERGGYGHAR